MKSGIEAAIQTELVRWAKETYPQFMIHATLNEDSRHKVSMGICVGITDLLIFLRIDGVLHVFFLELKRKKGKLSPSEIAWAENYFANFSASNTHYACAYGLQEAKQAIVKWMESYFPKKKYLPSVRMLSIY